MKVEARLSEPGIRAQIVHVVLVALAVVLVGKAAYVQLWQHGKWAKAAARQQVAVSTVPAPRGDIEDETGLALAHSRELVRLAVAPHEVRDLGELKRGLRTLGIAAADIRRAADTTRKWVELRQPVLATRARVVQRLRGVHSSRVGDRVYVPSFGARQLLGAVNLEGRGVSGLELQFDSLLRGTPGRARSVKGLRGVRFESPETVNDEPTRGHVVRLTLNQTLQNICEKALADAVHRLRADGGDVVVLDPKSGEVRCLAGLRPGGVGSAVSALVEPYEPGSTLKPFFAARLLERNKARPDEVIETFNGKYEVAGRVITDVHKAPRMSLRDVIRFSSNVGIARFVERLGDGDMYEMLRDLGFGTPTGVSFPSEASGTLRSPKYWSGQSHASLSIGYELAVTPLQLATAYGALANDGFVTAPTLIKEIRDADGAVVYSHRPLALRKVFTSQAIETVLPMLESVVDSGTAVDAGLATFTLAGKSGTARRTVNGAYGHMTYTSSFVGIFPAQRPQYVVLAKVDNPRTESIYGGKVAAPLARAVLEGALAARDAALDWSALVEQRKPVDIARGADAASVAAAGTVPGDTVPTRRGEPPIDTTLNPDPNPPTRFDVSKPIREIAQPKRLVTIPNVSGLPLRVAVRQLHRAGLEVIVAPGTNGGGITRPAAGSAVQAGSLVRLARP